MKDAEYQAGKRVILELRNDWNKYIRDCLGLRLDREQRKIVDSVQANRRTSVRSGHARGKDYVAAALSVTFFNLYMPSKVINTAPTGRQAINIMMAEISRIYRTSKIRPGGELNANMIKMTEFPSRESLKDWFLLAFKASDKATESWTGFHSPNIFIVVTEASGIEQETFDAIEGCLTGQLSRLLLVFNPNRTSGEAFQSSRSPQYAKHNLNCLKAPNVRAKKILIPGQVDYEWVYEKIKKPGWCTSIDEREADPIGFRDFRFDGQWYRPSDLFLVKVIGDFPREGETQLVPLSWIEAANARWYERGGKGDGKLILGCDIAGMGVDTTVLASRRGTTVEKFYVYSKSDHMVTCGRIKGLLGKDILSRDVVDTIGEGAGVHSRLIEMGVKSISAKFSEGTNGRRDLTGEREFANMRAWCYWAVRDALDPQLGGELALPPDDELTQELTATHWEPQSNGKIKIIDKEEIKKEIGRSPDKADSVALTYWPLMGGWGKATTTER